MTGRTVLITGAARGIGAAVAERLHTRGANVALVGLEPQRLSALASRLGERRVIWLEADVTDTAALTAAVESTVARFGGLDVAIANAGLAFSGTVMGSPPEQVERLLAVNLLGVWRTDRAVIAQIVEHRGYLLNVASLGAVLHAPLNGLYAAAKAGVEALTDALRVELSPSGAAVGCAYFGFIDTDLTRATHALPSMQPMKRRMPGPLRRPLPVSAAVTAIERGIERRAARVWAPRWVGAAIALRGILQPLSERLIARDQATLLEGMRLADEEGARTDEELRLGVAALAEPHRRVGRGRSNPGT